MKKPTQICFTRVNSFLLSLVVLVCTQGRLFSAEFVLIQSPITHTSATDGESLVQPTAGIPTNWNSPDNYLGGTAHFELEIVAKPSEASMHYSICAVQGNTSACSEPFHAAGTGIHQWSQPLAEWAELGQIDWSGSVDLVLAMRDCNNNVISPNNDDWCGAPFLGIYYPMEVNFTVMIISTGSVFSGWTNTPVQSPQIDNHNNFKILFSSQNSAGEFEFTILNQTGKPAGVTLYNSRGQQLQSWAQAGSNSVWQINSSPVHRGIFFLQIRAGTQSESFKFIYQGGR